MSDVPAIEVLRGPAIATKLAPDDDGRIEGWLVRYNEIDGDAETFAFGAFRASLEELAASGHRPPLLWQHDTKQPVGSWHALSETAEGVYGKAQINTDVAKGREALSLVRRGDLSGLSVGFAAATRRGLTILSGKLMEGSLVSIPCAPKARIKLKDCGSVPELVDALMAGRVARRDVEYLARKGWSGAPDEPDPHLDALAEKIARVSQRLKGL